MQEEIEVERKQLHVSKKKKKKVKALRVWLCVLYQVLSVFA